MDFSSWWFICFGNLGLCLKKGKAGEVIAIGDAWQAKQH